MQIYDSILERLTGALLLVFVAVAITSLLLLGATMMSRSARAQSANPELPRAALVKLLKDRYAEVPAAFGLDRDGWLVEVFTNGDSATWTIVRTRPSGESFVVTTGQLWTIVKPSCDEMSSAHNHRSLDSSRGKRAEHRNDPPAVLGKLNLVSTAPC